MFTLFSYSDYWHFFNLFNANKILNTDIAAFAPYLFIAKSIDLEMLELKIIFLSLKI